MDTILLDLVTKLYTLSSITGVEKVEKGVLSENWFINTADARFFLKKYRFDDEVRIKEIHLAKFFFAEHGIPVILPLENSSGKSYLSYEGSYYALFPFVSARELERLNLSDTAIVSMGTMLARIHLAGKGSTLDVQKEGFKFWDESDFRRSVESYLQHIDGINEPSSFDVLARNDLELKLSLVGDDSRQYKDLELAQDHLIHGDYLDHNLFFDEHDEVSHVFDLEKSQYAARSYELIRSLLYSVMAPNLGDDNLHKARLYIDSYRKMYPMGIDEFRKGMETFFLKSIRGIWIQKELYVLGNRRPEQFLAEDMARTRFLAEHRVTLVDALMS